MNYPGTKTLDPIEDVSALVDEIKPTIKSQKSFQSGKIDKYGKVVGVREFTGNAIPFERQIHHYDAKGRVVYFEKFEREFSKPSVRMYRYQDATASVTESVWVDRYGTIEHYHRYTYDPVSGLLVWRAEYDVYGNLFYSIRSSYDAKFNLIEEAWYDANNTFLKRHAYTYYPKGDMATESHFNNHNQLRGFNAFKYDTRGNMLERAWHDGQGIRRSLFAYTFDKQDRVASLQLIGPDGKLQVKQDFTYDAKNSVIREVWTDETGAVVKDLRY